MVPRLRSRRGRTLRLRRGDASAPATIRRVCAPGTGEHQSSSADEVARESRMKPNRECFMIRTAENGQTFTVACIGEIDVTATKALRDATLFALNSRCPLIV